MGQAISDRLKVIRSDFGLNQKKFAAKFGISFRTVQLHEGGKPYFSPEILEKYYAEGVNLNWLVSGDGSPYREETKPLSAPPPHKSAEEMALATTVAYLTERCKQLEKDLNASSKKLQKFIDAGESSAAG